MVFDGISLMVGGHWVKLSPWASLNADFLDLGCISVHDLITEHPDCSEGFAVMAPVQIVGIITIVWSCSYQSQIWSLTATYNCAYPTPLKAYAFVYPQAPSPLHLHVHCALKDATQWSSEAGLLGL